MAAGGAHTGAVLRMADMRHRMMGLMMSYFGLNRVRPDLTTEFTATRGRASENS
ncbi:MAG: hypothetical protein ACLTK0_09575 [Anaerovoracaceae bacterium]